MAVAGIHLGIRLRKKLATIHLAIHLGIRLRKKLATIHLGIYFGPPFI